MSTKALAEHVNLIPNTVLLLLELAAARILRENEKRRIANHRRYGSTLRPGAKTPLWNDLRNSVRESTRTYGEQAKLARILGLPRQRVNSFLTGGSQMPDAERTLLLLGWLAAKREGRPVS